VKNFGLERCLFGVAAAVAMLPGCGARALPVGPSLDSAALRGDARGPRASGGDLLYVANQTASFGVNVLTFPAGTIVTSISNIGEPRGICSDPHGNVWVTTHRTGAHPFDIYKFAHGGTKPIETLHSHENVYACTVDPATGDLAVIGYRRSSTGEIDIWPPKGKPTIIPISFNPIALAYDDRSNIFIDGVALSGIRELVEMPKGSKDLTRVKLGRLPTWNPGSVQWDGKYIAVGIGSSLKASFIDRVQVTSSGGKVIGSVQLDHLATFPRFAIEGDEIVATERHPLHVSQVALYKYPAGGKQIDVFSGFDDPVGMTISVGRK
jgi:hypothetical protein